MKFHHQGRLTGSGFCLLIALLGLVETFSIGPVRAESKGEGRDDEYNFSWLDPDKKIYVLQNRKYKKAERLLLSGMFGFGSANSYRRAYNLDARMAYYFTEQWGVEALFTYTFNRANDDDVALRRATTILPKIREVRGLYGGLAHWAPWYAKINVFNQILYFDWYFTGGLGGMYTALDTNTVTGAASVYKSENRLAFFLGTGHQYHLSQDFIARLDFLGAFFRAPIYGDTGGDTWYSNLNFNFGIGIKI